MRRQGRRRSGPSLPGTADTAQQERQLFINRFGLDPNGRRLETWETETDTTGGFGLIQIGDQPFPVATVTAAPAHLPSLLSQLSRFYRSAGIAEIACAGELPLLDGSQMKLVLSQRVGALWTLYFGCSEVIDRLFYGTATVMHTWGQAELYHEWEIRVSDPSYPLRWADMVQSVGAVLFYAYDQDPEVPLEGSAILVPAANVQVRPLLSH